MPRLANLPAAADFDTYEQFSAAWDLEYQADPKLFMARLDQHLADEVFANEVDRDLDLDDPSADEPLSPEIEWHHLWEEWPENLAA